MARRSHQAWAVALLVALAAITIMLLSAVIDGMASASPSVTFSIDSTTAAP